jgi:hypothetical protein
MKNATTTNKPIDVNQLLSQKSADAFMLHGTNLGYVLTFSEKVCTELHQLAQAKTGLSVSFPIDNSVVGGANLLEILTKCRKMSLLCTLQTLVPPFAHEGRHNLVHPNLRLKLMLQSVVPMVVGS